MIQFLAQAFITLVVLDFGIQVLFHAFTGRGGVNGSPAEAYRALAKMIKKG